MSGKNKELLLLLIILAVASFFRLWQLDKIPGGLFPDEAANGLDILLIFQSQHSPFFERGLGREALFLYLQAGSVALFGIGVWQMHIVSALIGILTVLILWFLAKKLFNARVAFLASIFMATSAWHVTLSRTGFRAILVPLFSTLFFYLAFLTLKEVSARKRKILAFLSGAVFGLGFYTYPSYRAIIPIALSLLIAVLIIKRDILKTFRRELLIGLITAVLVLSPLVIYFINHPWSFMGRSGYVSVFNEDMNQGDLVGTFLNVAKKTFLMFFTQGDLNWRHNVSGYPMLNPWISLFFAFGFLYCLFIVVLIFFRKNRSDKSFIEKWLVCFFLIFWLLGMLGPEILTAENIPHGLRAIGAIPASFLLAAFAIDFILKKAGNLANLSYFSLFSSIFLILIVLVNAVYDYGLYFGVSANSPDFYYAYRSDLTLVSAYLNERNLRQKTYLVLDEYSVQTPEFLTAKTNQPYILVNPEKSYQTELRPGEQIIFTQSTIFDAKKFKEYHPQAQIVKQNYNQFKQEIMRAYAQ